MFTLCIIILQCISTTVYHVMKKQKRKILILHVIIPLLVGAFIYYLLSPDVIFVKLIHCIISDGFHDFKLLIQNPIIRLVRFYVLDMLWGYTLVFSLYFILGNSTADLKKIFLIAFAFSAAMEMLQLTSLARGTFDICDILVEFLAEILAVIIIKSIR